MIKNINVTKRDGSVEVFDAEKVNKVLEWATEGVAKVNSSDIAMRANISLVEKMSTSDIHETLVDSAKDMIDEFNPNYSKVAARLFIYMLRKKVWGGKNAPKLLDLIKKNSELGFYDPAILENYSKEEINKVDELIDHSRDDQFDYGGMVQLSEKYLVQNRETKEILETPQFAFALMGMVIFQNEAKKERIGWIKKFYDETSKHTINWPTPILSGARSKTKSYSSCCLIDVLDTKESLFAANTAAGLVTCDRYGVGINLSNLRPVNAPIKGGDTLHSGVIAWLKMYQDTIHACQQGGARRGAGTVTFPIFHPEIMTILELKNNQGTHENRVPHLDYLIAGSGIFHERFKQNGEISLFSSHDARDLYAAFGLEEFDELYVKYEKSDTPRITISAHELYSKFFVERVETARIYFLNIDQANKYSPWKDRVTMSNLCVEILQPTKAERYTNDPEGEIGVCVLAATNMLKVRSDAHHKKICELEVRVLDNIISLQEYSIPACERFATRKRSLGVGVTNLAGWLASQGLNHNSEGAPQVVSDFMEKQQYYLMGASCKLAEERGPAPDFERSKYFKGEFSPLDLYNKNVDKIVKSCSLDWEVLMSDITEYGMRNMTVSAQMPCESSSVIQASTNGGEPITAYVISKTSKGKTATQVVPGIAKYKKHYLLKSDIKNDNKGIIHTAAALAKWLCMASSFNVYYDHNCFEDESIPMSILARDHLYASHLGLKTFYYCNPAKKKDSSANIDLDEAVIEIEEESGCDGGGCAL